MYRVTIYNDSTGTIIHEPTVSPDDPHLYTGTLTQGSSGEIDSLQFDILPNNPGYDLLASRTTMVQVMDTTNNTAIFTGRVLTVTPQMEESGLVFKSVVCEDRLGYLCDSIQPYTPEATYTLEDFFTLLLENHNSQVEDYKKIYPGYISMTTSSGNVTKGLNYQTTWECIKSKLLDSVGGEIQLYTGADGLLYLDYVAELGSTGTPTIALGKNMKSVSREIDPTSVITRLIPLGAKAEITEDDPDADVEERLTIADVNGGVIYLDDEAAQAVYGIVEGIVEWEDVTEASNLLTKAQAWLDAQTVIDQITLTAVDLYLAGIEAEAIERYNYYLVTHEGLGLNGYYRVVKVTRNICNPTEITYGMGGQSKSLASTLTSASNNASSAVADATAAVNAQLSKTVAALIVSNATITELTAKVATIEEAYIDEATINTLLAGYIKTDELEAEIATIGYLTADSAVITDLTAEVANINSVLAGNIGAGTVQTVHLTSENVVIDDAVITDAMIVDLTASKITSGTIYTNLVTVQSESGNLYITDNTIQIQDDGDTVRVQIGEDASGDYNLYLWDASGNLLWDAGGLYAAGIHDGIIKDIAVADDAAISGSKLDIASVAERLNEDGSLTVNAAQVTIDDTTLEYRLTSVTTATDEAAAAAQAAKDMAAALESEAVASLTQYYAVGTSADTPPSTPEDGTVWPAALADTAVVGESMVEVTDTDGDWTTEYPTLSEGQYLWTAFYVVYADETEGWTTPTCLSDGVAREAVSTLQTEFEVVQGQITAKVWQTDIDTAVDELGGSITTLQDQYSSVTETLDGITTEVADIKTTVSDNYEALDSKITTVETTASGITATVSDLQDTVTANYTTLNDKITTVETTADGITASVSSIQTRLDTVEGTVSSTVASVEVQYALGTSATTAPTTGWSTTAPEWVDGKYMWQKTVTTYSDGTTEESAATCISGATGATGAAGADGKDGADGTNGSDGADGMGISSVVPQYYLSTSASSCTGGTWSDTMPEWESGCYIWTRSYITWEDGTTSTTSPTLAGAINTANETANTALTTATETKAELQVLSDSITAKVSTLETTVDDNYTTLSSKISSLAVTTDSITASVSSVSGQVSDLSATVDSSVTDTTAFYIIGTSDTEPPCEPGEDYVAACVDEAEVGDAFVVDDDDADGGWTTEQLTAGEGEYLWMCYRLDYNDGTSAWTTPVCMTDGYARASIEVLSDSIALCVTTDADTGYLRLGSGEDDTVKFTVDTDNFTIDESGNVSMAGKITATTGTIGGWNIYSTKICGTTEDETTVAVMQISGLTEGTAYVFAAGPSEDGHSSYKTCPFRVNKLGQVWADGLVSTAYLVAGNDEGLYCDDSSGTHRRVAYLSTNDNMVLGNTNFPTYLYGTTIYANDQRVKEVQHGNVAISVSAADTPTSVEVTFPTAFSGVPDVVVSAATSSPATSFVGVLNPSSTGCTIYLTRTTTGEITVRWMAAY